MDQLSPAVQQALFELVAFTVNENAKAMHFNLDGLKAENRPLGDWEVVVQRWRVRPLALCSGTAAAGSLSAAHQDGYQEACRRLFPHQR